MYSVCWVYLLRSICNLYYLYPPSVIVSYTWFNWLLYTMCITTIPVFLSDRSILNAESVEASPDHQVGHVGLLLHVQGVLLAVGWPVRASLLLNAVVVIKTGLGRSLVTNTRVSKLLTFSILREIPFLGNGIIFIISVGSQWRSFEKWRIST